ncbi:alpha/beta hydrolase [Thermocrispum municipale]|jgi:alpha-beta hydrolase superfamily lysophospholipase|uniref:alpha/beta hydrolase n=1 Tax=Thermocrispum municipale TaxID=37926 RepID=UPI000400349D|nr:alpha/beta fold hydrolase [Thermocrispum municipale]
MTDAAIKAPDLRLLATSGRTGPVVLLLHGGTETSHEPVRPWSGPYLRMISFGLDMLRVGRTHGIAAAMVRNRVRGWNKPHLDPVHDARWALEQIRRRRPEAPIVLVGHSMGGRVALHVADDPAVVGVAALAPWTPAEDGVDAVRDVPVLIAHGLDDTITKPEDSLAYARRAAEVTDVVRFELPAETHALLWRAPTWHRLVRSFALHAFGLQQAAGPLRYALSLAGEQRLRVRV